MLQRWHLEVEDVPQAVGEAPEARHDRVHGSSSMYRRDGLGITPHDAVGTTLPRRYP